MGVYVYQNEQLDKVAGLGYDVVDSAISSSSENPVQNKVVKEYVDTKVSKDQGVAQSGKVLGINASGMVEPVDVAGSASDITYDNSTSGLSATDVQGAVDEVDSVVDGLGTAVDGLESQVSTLITDTGLAYKTTDTTDTTVDDADSIPFYDTSASAKKKITWSNIVTKIKTSLANYFGRKFSQSGGKLSLLSDNNTILNTVTLSPLASNTSYTDTNNIRATNVQSAIDTLGNYTYGTGTLNSAYVSSGSVSYMKLGKICIVLINNIIFSALPPRTQYQYDFVTGLPKAKVIPTPYSFMLTPINQAHPPIRLALASQGTTLSFYWTQSTVTSGAEYAGLIMYPCE